MAISTGTVLWTVFFTLIISDIFLFTYPRLKNSGLYTIMLISNYAEAVSFWSYCSSNPAHKQMPDRKTVFWLSIPLVIGYNLIEYYLATSAIERGCAIIVNVAWTVSWWAQDGKKKQATRPNDRATNKEEKLDAPVHS